MTTDPNETQKANQGENKPLSMVDRMKKLDDSKLKEKVDESIHHLIYKIEKSTMQYELLKKLMDQEHLQ